MDLYTDLYRDAIASGRLAARWMEVFDQSFVDPDTRLHAYVHGASASRPRSVRAEAGALISVGPAMAGNRVSSDDTIESKVTES